VRLDWRARPCLSSDRIARAVVGGEADRVLTLACAAHGHTNSFHVFAILGELQGLTEALPVILRREKADVAVLRALVSRRHDPHSVAASWRVCDQII